MLFRFRHKTLGGHVHVTLFCNGRAGSFVLSIHEWSVLRGMLEAFTDTSLGNKNILEFIEETPSGNES